MSATAAPTAGTRSVQRPGLRRTLLALLASALGVVPLMSLMNDGRWLVEAWLAMAVVILPAALLRIRRAPGALDIWPGIVLLIPWLTWMYLSDNAWHGFIPTGATFTDISSLMTDLHDTTSHEVAPIHSTVAARLVISALLGLLVALIDLIAVVGRRGALAGVPLLIVYTVSGAIPRDPVSWLWFVVAAAGYLILLALDAADELLDWGRRVSRAGAARSRPGLAFSAQRIGVIAVVAAVALPLLVPDDTRNLLADAFHDKDGGGLGSIGATGTNGTSISPYIELKGQLDRDKPVEVMTVHVDTSEDVQPFYVRLNVLDAFTGDGWRPGVDHGFTEPVSATTYPALPSSGEPTTQSFRATITISALAGNVPVFNTPVNMQGLDAGTTWSPQDQLLLGADVRQGQQITEDVSQPAPTLEELRADSQTTSDMSKWLALPPLPTYVTDLVSRLTAGKQTSFDRAQAIFQYFADPDNRFQYSLETAVGDSGSDLVDFLQNKRGFCQQYAGAMGVMLRAANVPTRIVLGYMHLPPDSSGNFSVSTFDAHSWVEAYFPGTGWIPFDPTPTAGLAGGKKTDLPWAQHSYSSLSGSEGPRVSTSQTPGSSQSQSSGGSANAAQHGSSGGGPDLALIVTVLAILGLIGLALIPAMVRWGRRRARLGAARRGDTDALWAELSDTAVDLGYVWSPARSPRQVATWLAGDAGDTAPALSALATAVEHRRYARDTGAGDGPALSEGLIAVTDRLWSRRSGRARLRARLWPASLGWGSGMSRVRGALRRH